MNEVGGLSSQQCSSNSLLVGEVSLTSLHNVDSSCLEHSFLVEEEFNLGSVEHSQSCLQTTSNGHIVVSNFSLCQGCGLKIKDKFLLKVLDCYWHENCLRCTLCSKPLTEFNTCYMKEGQIYCKDDHRQLFATKCAQCGLVLQPTDFVLRCYQKTFHAECFQCSYCTQSLKKGQLYVLVDNQIICQRDYNHIFATSHQRYLAARSNGIGLSYENNPISSSNNQIARYDPQNLRPLHHPMLSHPEHNHHHHHHSHHGSSSSKKIPKRPRTILNAQQRKAFKYAFDRGPKPSRKVCEWCRSGFRIREPRHPPGQVIPTPDEKEHRKVDHQVDHHKQHSSSASMNTVSTDSDGKSAADDEMKSPMGSIKSDSSEMDGFDMEDDDRSSIITDISRLSSTAHLQEPTQPLYGNITKNVLGDRESMSAAIVNPIDNLYRMHNTYFLILDVVLVSIQNDLIDLVMCLFYCCL